jgi:hypothetical protein
MAGYRTKAAANSSRRSDSDSKRSAPKRTTLPRWVRRDSVALHELASTAKGLCNDSGVSSTADHDARVMRRDLREAEFFLRLGRVLIVGSPAAVIAARLARGLWGPNYDPAHGPWTHWVPITAMLLALAWVILLPSLLLPITPVILLESKDGQMSGPTVLGRRHLDAGSVRVEWSMPVPGRVTTVIHLLRDAQHAWLMAEDVGVPDLSSATESPETLIETARTAPVAKGMRLWGWATSIGWFICKVALWVGFGFVVYG